MYTVTNRDFRLVLTVIAHSVSMAAKSAIPSLLARTSVYQTYRGLLVGDGAGCLVAMPHDFLKLIAQQDCNVDLPSPDEYGVAMCFLPNSDDALYKRAKEIITETADSLGHKVLGWRKVPTDGTDVGPSALSTEPVIEQMFISNSSQSTYGKTDVEQQVSGLALALTGTDTHCA